MDKKKDEFTEFLEQLVVAISGKDALKNLNELADIGGEIITIIKKQEPIPPEKIERWNELLKLLYPDQYKD